MLFGLFGKSSDINLIPEEEQKLRTKKIRSAVLVVLAAILAGEVLAYVGVFLVDNKEKSQQKKLQYQLSADNLEWQEVSTPAATLKAAKGKISLYQSFLSTHPAQEARVKKIQDSLPVGIRVKTLSVTGDGSVQLEGEAQRPAIVYQSLNYLNENKQDFDSPKIVGISKLGAASYDFIFSFKLK